MTTRTARLRRLVPLLLAAFLTASAVFGVSARYRGVDLLVLALLYFCASHALYAAAATLLRCGRVAGMAGAFLFTFVPVWHFREQTFLPGSILEALLLAALLAVPYHRLETRWLTTPSGDPPSGPTWRGLLLSMLATVVVWVGAYQTSPMLRWHLLRHNTMLGTPAYYLLDESVLSRKEALFAPHREAGSPPQVPAVSAPPASETGRPNIVFVLLDTLRADALAVHGGDPAVMPRLNRFFDGAYRFTDVRSSGGWTRPSVATMFTGLLPEEHGARLLTDALTADNVTLPEILQESGYRTAAFVANVAAINRDFGFAQGFEIFKEFDDLPYARAEKVKKYVLRWLAADPDLEDSWFIYLHFLDPHEPYLSGEAPRLKRPKSYLRAYREELRYLDRELGEVLDALRRELPEPTLFFVTSDHGEEFFEHELFGHAYTLYEEVARIPAALHTGQGPGRDIEARLESRDFFDLLVSSAAGGELSIEAWANRKQRDLRYASLYFGSEGRLLLRPYLRHVCTRALEQDDYKLIWSAFGDTYELYDLSRDPGELRNLAAEEPERVARMADALDDQVSFWRIPEAVELSAEALERLRTLGYVDD